MKVDTPDLFCLQNCKLVDRLTLFCSNKSNEVVDLFYAISDCHGWVKSTDREVRVRLEPLQ